MRSIVKLCHVTKNAQFFKSSQLRLINTINDVKVFQDNEEVVENNTTIDRDFTFFFVSLSILKSQILYPRIRKHVIWTFMMSELKTKGFSEIMKARRVRERAPPPPHHYARSHSLSLFWLSLHHYDISFFLSHFNSIFIKQISKNRRSTVQIKKWGVCDAQ